MEVIALSAGKGYQTPTKSGRDNMFDAQPVVVYRINSKTAQTKRARNLVSNIGACSCQIGASRRKKLAGDLFLTWPLQLRLPPKCFWSFLRRELPCAALRQTRIVAWSEPRPGSERGDDTFVAPARTTPKGKNEVAGAANRSPHRRAAAGMHIGTYSSTLGCPGAPSWDQVRG